MKKLFIIFLFTACASAQITDETLNKWFVKYPQMREALKQERPELFKTVTLDTTYDSVIRIYKSLEGYYLAVVVVNGNIWLVADMGVNFDNCVLDSLNGDKFRLVSQNAAGTTPRHIKEILDALKK